MGHLEAPHPKATPSHRATGHMYIPLFGTPERRGEWWALLTAMPDGQGIKTEDRGKAEVSNA